MTNGITRYALILFASAALLLACVVGFNAIVDPFAMYRMIEIKGFNSYKPAIVNRVRLLKAYEVRRFQPESIVLGSSRVHLGISPDHSIWSKRYERRYNLAFDGATTKEMYHYLVHTNADGNLRHVMLGLDSYHLSGAPASTRPDFDASLLRNQRYWFNIPRMILADLRILTSIATLRESLHTLKSQVDSQPDWLVENGQRLGEVFFRRPEEQFVSCGPRCYFDEIDKLEIRYKLEWRIPEKPGRTIPLSGPPQKRDPLNSMNYVEKIISYCREHGIKLNIFLTPSHVHQLELDALTDAWWSVENGKRQIVRLLNEDQHRYPDQPAIHVYDFNGYSPITTDSLPDKESLLEMLNYWDSSHFKENIGNLVLNRILAPDDDQPPPSGNDFGVRLTVANIDVVIERLRLAQVGYRTKHPSEIAQLREWVTEFKKTHNIE